MCVPLSGDGAWNGTSSRRGRGSCQRAAVASSSDTWHPPARPSAPGPQGTGYTGASTSFLMSGDRGPGSNTANTNTCIIGVQTAHAPSECRYNGLRCVAAVRAAATGLCDGKQCDCCVSTPTTGPRLSNKAKWWGMPLRALGGGEFVVVWPPAWATLPRRSKHRSRHWLAGSWDVSRRSPGPGPGGRLQRNGGASAGYGHAYVMVGCPIIAHDPPHSTRLLLPTPPPRPPLHLLSCPPRRPPRPTTPTPRLAASDARESLPVPLPTRRVAS